MVKFKMKLVYEEFFCPKCEHIRNLRMGNMCVDCKDRILLDEISQSRKMQNVFNEQICV